MTRLITFYFLYYFLVIHSNTVANLLGSYSGRNNRLKCEENYKESSFVVGKSDEFSFEGHSNTLREEEHDVICCKWVFKATHEGSSVEMKVIDVKSSDCSISYVDVFISNAFATKICDLQSINGFKFIGSNISLNYICVDSFLCDFTLKVTFGEASPASTDCDFIMAETGYRYYLMYDLIDPELIPRYEVKGMPYPGMVINNIEYRLYFVNRENLGATVCFHDEIILPRELVPSCHSSTDERCEWEMISGIEKVKEIFELKGTQWKIQQKGQFQSRSAIQLEALCLYIDYYLDNAKKALVTIYGHISGHKPVLIIRTEITGRIWRVERIISDIPLSIKNKKIQLSLEIELQDSMSGSSIYINKIYGCNPFSKEDRILISSGRNTVLYGSYRKAPVGDNSKACQNGALLIDNRCVCPVGLSGDLCEKFCEKNRFGLSCGSECSSKKGCKGVIFCDNFFGCSCVPGFKGYYCQSECGDWWLCHQHSDCSKGSESVDCNMGKPYNMTVEKVSRNSAFLSWSKDEEEPMNCTPKIFQLTVKSGSNQICFQMKQRDSCDCVALTYLYPGMIYTVRLIPEVKDDPLVSFVSFQTIL